MKKSTIAFLIIITMIFSGFMGYLGGNLSVNYTQATSFGETAAWETVSKDVEAHDTALQDIVLPDSESTNTKQSDTIPEILSTPSSDISLLTDNGDTSTSTSLTIAQIAALASSSVVEIYTERLVNSGRMGQFVTEGAGSGVIISTNGYIATNNHVIKDSSKIIVRLNNGIDYEAELIGRDSKTDLAVLKIETTGLEPAIFGDSDGLVTGELAVAIGNPLGKLGGTVSEGIISALSRNIEIDGNMMTLLQTTAAVNPGNSGGGLFNSYGELIGIVNAKSSGSDIEGIGFAIPANLAKSIIEALIEYGYVPGRIDLGVILIDINDPMTAMMYRLQAMGVYVMQTDSDTDLIPGDLIVSINDKEIVSISDVNELLEILSVNDVLSVVVYRNGNTITIKHSLKQALS